MIGKRGEHLRMPSAGFALELFLAQIGALFQHLNISS
jgi:hypothetical protein